MDVKQCKQCLKTKNTLEFYKHIKYKDKLRPVCKLCCIENSSLYDTKHKLQKCNRTKKYYRKYKDKCLALTRKNRLSRINRIPKWLSIDDYIEIQRFYNKAYKLTKETGIVHHVDHIVPLRGKNVSGLHVPWNLQVITATENIKKRNKF